MLWSIPIGTWEKRLLLILPPYSIRYLNCYFKTIAPNCCFIYFKLLFHMWTMGVCYELFVLAWVWRSFLFSGSWSYRSSLPFRSWVWQHWNCHPSPIHHTFDGGNTGKILYFPSLQLWDYVNYVIIDEYADDSMLINWQLRNSFSFWNL